MASGTAQVWLPLTTVFTPPASCSPTSFVLYEGDLAIYPDHNQLTGPLRTECFPSGFTTASPFSPAPSVCPVGYSVACQTTSGEVTSAVCCPSGWPCTDVPWSSLATSGWPCGKPSGLPFTYTGLYQANIDSPVLTTTTFGTDSFNSVWSIGMGVFIDWQKSDLPQSIALGAITTTATSSNTATPQGASQSTSSSPAPTGPPIQSSSSSAFSSGFSTAAKAGIGIGAALTALLVLGLGILFLRRQQRSRARANDEGSADDSAVHGPPSRLAAQLATRTDAPELEGDWGRKRQQYPAAVAEKETKINREKRIAELEAELTHLRTGNTAEAVELP